MIQHVDEVARAMRKDRIARTSTGRAYDPEIEPSDIERLDARAAMRAVVKQMREPSEAMIEAVNCSGDWGPGISCDETDANPHSCFQAMLDAYVKEAGIDE